jgi:hypothetical protein
LVRVLLRALALRLCVLLFPMPVLRLCVLLVPTAVLLLLSP